MHDREWSRSRYWLCHFLQSRHERLPIDWRGPARIDPNLTEPLWRWLAGSRRSPGDGGRRLIAQAQARCVQDPAYVQCLRLCLKEQLYHEKLLQQAIHRLGGGAAPAGNDARWVPAGLSHTLGLRFELSLLVLEQIIDAALCRAVRDGANDPALVACCEQLLRDKLAHQSFHAERLTLEFADFNFVRRNIRRLRLRAMFVVGLAQALWRHRALLKASGCPAPRFTAGAWAGFSAVLERMVPYRREALLAALLWQRDRPYDEPVQAG